MRSLWTLSSTLEVIPSVPSNFKKSNDNRSEVRSHVTDVDCGVGPQFLELFLSPSLRVFLFAALLISETTAARVRVRGQGQSSTNIHQRWYQC